MSLYHSQYGQDKLVHEVFFHKKKDGVFVEIGAYDGLTMSNTLFFEKELNWTGLLVEPNPIEFEKLKNNRPNCLLENVAVASEKGFLDFTMISGYSDALSGLSNYYDDRHKRRIRAEIQEHNQKELTIEVVAVPLSELLVKHKLSVIDYLSIDVEGAEMEVLQSIDFNKTKISVITLENNYKDKKFSRFLQKIGYKYLDLLKIDEVYYHPELERLANKYRQSKIPSNHISKLIHKFSKSDK